jgi:hypothetical protein
MWVREGDSGAEPDAVEISYLCGPYMFPGTSREMEYSDITYVVLYTSPLPSHSFLTTQ